MQSVVTKQLVSLLRLCFYPSQGSTFKEGVLIDETGEMLIALPKKSLIIIR